MQTISDIQKKYCSRLDQFDLELLIAHVLGKPREFVLAHPEFSVTSKQSSAISKLIKRRLQGEPVAYLVGHKEFYDLDFTVNKHTLVPRPETELLAELAIQETRNKKQETNGPVLLIDVGTGSGCIIISVAHSLKNTSAVIPGLTRNPALGTAPDSRLRGNDKLNYYAIDISKEALKLARKNAKAHDLDKKIKFLHGNLLGPIIEAKKLTKLKANKLVILANLPYLSQEIYENTPRDVKKYEPKSALYSPEQGLQHYRQLLQQIKKTLLTAYCLPITVFLEISPEQKVLLSPLVKKILPAAKIKFHKDLAGKYRVCRIQL